MRTYRAIVTSGRPIDARSLYEGLLAAVRGADQLELPCCRTLPWKDKVAKHERERVRKPPYQLVAGHSSYFVSASCTLRALMSSSGPALLASSTAGLPSMSTPQIRRRQLFFLLPPFNFSRLHQNSTTAPLPAYPTTHHTSAGVVLHPSRACISAVTRPSVVPRVGRQMH